MPAAGAAKPINVRTKLPYLSLRQEEWGGIVVHGPTLSVFQVDAPAFLLLSRLKGGESLLDLQGRPQPLTAAEVDAFIDLVHSFGLEPLTPQSSH
jgi:hypothetical protein